MDANVFSSDFSALTESISLMISLFAGLLPDISRSAPMSVAA
jgi:hypothetical protein